MTPVELPDYWLSRPGVEPGPDVRASVEPGDLPFLSDIRGHDDDRLAEYARALETGAPWPE
jgi:hypothetical protein